MHEVHHTAPNHCIVDSCTPCVTEGCVKGDKTWSEVRRKRFVSLQIKSWILHPQRRREQEKNYRLGPWWFMYVLWVLITSLSSSLCACVTHRLWQPPLAAAPECRTANEYWSVRVFTQNRPLLLRFCYYTSCSLFAGDNFSPIFS